MIFFGFGSEHVRDGFLSVFSRLCEHEMICKDVFGLGSLVGTLVFDFGRLRSSQSVVFGSLSV